MPNFENIDPIGYDLDRRSFLRSTGTIAAAMVTGGLSFPAIAQQGGPSSAERLVNGRRKLGQLEVEKTEAIKVIRWCKHGRPASVRAGACRRSGFGTGKEQELIA